MGEEREALERIGLSENESRIYLTLLRHGASKAGAIAKNSVINRTTTYDCLKTLMEKGLVSSIIKTNRKWFEAVEPERLLDIVKEREEETKKLLPMLKKLYKLPEEKRGVTLYHGKNGVKSVFMDIIREGKINRVLDSEGQFTERLPYFAPQYVMQLEKKGIKVKHIVREGRNVKPSKSTEVRFIQKKIKSDAVINIYGNKVAIIVWSRPPEVAVIENKSVADSFKDYFEIIWEIAKKK